MKPDVSTLHPPEVPLIRERLTRGLMGRRPPGDHRYPNLSRDWEPADVKCRVAYCPMNRNQRCTLPSQIDIRPDGICQKAIDFKPTPK